MSGCRERIWASGDMEGCGGPVHHADLCQIHHRQALQVARISVQAAEADLSEARQRLCELEGPEVARPSRYERLTKKERRPQEGGTGEPKPL